MSMSMFEQVAEKLAIKPMARSEHPSLVITNKLLPDGQEDRPLPVPPGNKLLWRINDVILLDNFDGLFDRNNEIRLMAITVDSDVAEPIRFLQMAPFPGIRKDGHLPLGDSGVAMYMSTPASFPSYLGLNLLIVEDDSDVREMASIINQAWRSPEYKAIRSAARSLASAANPLYGTLVAIGESLVGLVTKLMEQNKDDLVAYFAATYTLAFDNLGVGKHTFHQDEHARVQHEILATT
jgi:hypothetical protein